MGEGDLVKGCVECSRGGGRGGGVYIFLLFLLSFFFLLGLISSRLSFYILPVLYLSIVSWEYCLLQAFLSFEGSGMTLLLLLLVIGFHDTSIPSRLIFDILPVLYLSMLQSFSFI